MDSNLREEITILHAQVCKGLADPNRILILYTLSDRPYTVNDLAEGSRTPPTLGVTAFKNSPGTRYGHRLAEKDNLLKTSWGITGSLRP